MEDPHRPPILSVPVAPDLRALIDEAVHACISRACEGKAEEGFGRCPDYAIVGARVLRLLTNKPYRPVAGGEIVDCGAGVVAVLATDRRTRRSVRHLSELSRYHCWIECEHIVNGEPRVEMIDFTVRHDPLVACTLGLLYSRAEPDPFLWCWRDALTRAFSESPLRDHPFVVAQRLPCPMWALADCTRLLHDYEQGRSHHFGRLASQVLTAVDDRIEAKFGYSQT